MTTREPDALDHLIDEAARALADPAIPHDLAQRLKLRSMFMSTAAAPSNLLLFTTTDRIRNAGDRRSVLGATLLHAAALALIAIAVHAATQTVARPKVEDVVLLAPVLVPPPAPPRSQAMAGGGGQHGPTPVTHGNLPKFAAQPLVPPSARPVLAPRLAVDPAVDVQQDIRMAHADTTNFGVANSPLVGLSMGNGRGGGLGEGNGNGIGPGSGGNTGGGIKHIGGGVTAPVVLFAPQAEFSEEARKAKVGGNVLVYLQVDSNGRPTHVRVLRGIGLGLDENAVAAVKQYRFKPALEDGRPVPVEMNVEVNFVIF